MDGHDRKELSALGELEKAREEYLKKHGSFLYCEQRDTLCVYMDGMWMTGCEREGCILDDPEHIALEKRIEENRMRIAEEHHKARLAEKNDPPSPIRDQRNRIKNYINMQLDEIHRIEEESRLAYLNNKPRLGDDLFNKARYMRGELRRFEEEKLKESR